MNCCRECFYPSYDKLVGPDYMVSMAMPEGCKDEECECHTLQASLPEKVSDKKV